MLIPGKFGPSDEEELVVEGDLPEDPLPPGDSALALLGEPVLLLLLFDELRLIGLPIVACGSLVSSKFDEEGYVKAYPTHIDHS